MQIIIAILMYLGMMQSPNQWNDPKFQQQYQPEIQQIQSQVPQGANGQIGQDPTAPNAINVIVDGTPVIIDIQEF